MTVCVSVCLCVCAVKGKRLELSTPNLMGIQLYDSRSACNDPERSKGQRSRSFGSLPALTCMSIGLPRFAIFVIFLNVASTGITAHIKEGKVFSLRSQLVDSR